MSSGSSIWLIVIGEPLPIERDSRPLRTRLLARKLAERGHQVTWWTSTFNHFTKSYHQIESDEVDSGEGYTLRFVHGRPYAKNLSLARQINHIQIAKDFTRQAAALSPPAAIVCSFPSIELTQAAVRFARTHDIPIIVDIRDLWPDEMLNRIPTGLKLAGEIALSPLERAVRWSLRHADSLVAVSQTYLDWGLRKARREVTPDDAVIPLGYPDSAAAVASRARERSARDDASALFFSGSFNNSVDLGTAIRAIAEIDMPNLSATFCGAGDNLDAWRSQAANDERIRFTGWINGLELGRIAERADVGLVCYRPESLVAMPNKLFEYMSFGIPMINAIPGEAANLIQQHGIGLNYAAGSAASLRDALVQMISQPEERLQMSRRATELYESRYATSNISSRYSELIEAAIR